ncbi:MAG: SRPBCC domain-containing protein [Acidobacteriota bacterium]
MHQALMIAALFASLSATSGADGEDAGSERTPPNERRPIDSGLFVADGPDVRRFELTADVPAPPATVFATLSDGDAFFRTFSKEWAELQADLDLAIGGNYEWLFDGKVGSNGCQILSYIPNRMISFTWNTPPNLADARERRTWVVVELEPSATGTAVRLTHLGFGSGPEWDDAYGYFQNAWGFVLKTLGKHLGGT